jgi:hypothetical protein
LALARLVLYCATNRQYEFHGDELSALADARDLDWGHVSYPPFTPFLARLASILFGPSLTRSTLLHCPPPAAASRSRGWSSGGTSSVSVDSAKSGAS